MTMALCMKNDLLPIDPDFELMGQEENFGPRLARRWRMLQGIDKRSFLGTLTVTEAALVIADYLAFLGETGGLDICLNQTKTTKLRVRAKQRIEDFVEMGVITAEAVNRMSEYLAGGLFFEQHRGQWRVT